jgi:excisionase family DNA binding protein
MTKKGQNPSHRFLTLAEVSQELRVPVSSIRKWIYAGKLKTVKPGKLLMVSRLELERFIQQASR